MASGVLLDRAVRWRLENLGNKIAGKGYVFQIGKVNSRFYEGSVDVLGITLRYNMDLVDSLNEGSRAELLNFNADKLKLRHVSYWSLFVDGEVHFKAIEIAQPEIHYYFKPGDLEEKEEEDEEEEPIDDEKITQEIPLITVDTLIILSAKGSTNDITGERPSFQIGGIDIHASDLRLRAYPNGRTFYSIGSANVHAWQLSAEFPPIYDLNVSDVQVDHPLGAVRVNGLRLDPRYDEQEYGDQLEHETDLFNIKVDTLLFLGIDVGRFIAEQSLHMHRMEIRSPVAQVYRDKTMKDGPFVHKSLPVSGLRNISVPLRIDTVQLYQGNVEYYEKDDKSTEYGMVSFSDINGVLTGINNTSDPDSTSHLVAHATARVYERTSVEMDYKASMASTHDSFTIDARLGSLPFSVFNRMTDDLLNVQATDGKIHSMHLRMQGNEDHATGTLDLEYQDLHVDLVPDPQKWHQGLLKNMFGNALVRSTNLRGQKNYRQGTIDTPRRKDRAVFNFLWQAVKSGSIDSMAPGFLRKQMQKAATPKTASVKGKDKRKRK